MKRRISPDGCFIVLLTLAVLFNFIFPIQRVIFYPYNFIGIIAIIVGIAMTILVNFLLLKNHTSINPYESPKVLTTSGLFKYSRNPLYLGMVIILFGVDIILGTISPFIFSILFILIINNFIIPMEEKNLENNFGIKYTEYKNKVRRWV